MALNSLAKFSTVLPSASALSGPPPPSRPIVTANICWATSVLLNGPVPFFLNHSA